MRLVQTTCNKCGAQLDIDLDHLVAFCPYCGVRSLMDFEKIDRVLTEKEKTKRAIEHDVQETKRTQMAYEYEFKKDDSSRKQKDKESKRSNLRSITILLILFLLPISGFLAFGIEHNNKVTYLQELEMKIESFLQEGDYDTALLNANKLYLDDNWSSEQTKAWDSKREAYIEIITAKKLEVDRNNPENIFMPTSSDSFDKKKYTEVVDQLKALGFTNITIQVAYEPATFFHKDGTVEHILIEGKTDFTTEDFFKKDAPIIIYYYSK